METDALRLYAIHPGSDRPKVRELAVDRRLAAVLQADAVSYSHLMATNEAETILAIKRHRAEGRVIRSLVSRRHDPCAH